CFFSSSRRRHTSCLSDSSSDVCSSDLGYAIAHFRKPDAKADDPDKEITTLACGEEVVLTTISGQRLSPVYARFVVADYFKSEMRSEERRCRERVWGAGAGER